MVSTMSAEKNSTGAEARLQISDSIFNVIYNYLDKGDGSDSDEFEAKLLAEDISSEIVNSIIIDIAESLDDDGNIVAILDSEL